MRSGGFILQAVEKPVVATSSSVSSRWCGVTSQVTGSRAPLRGPHQLEAARRRQVGDVVTTAAVLEQDEVARHHHVLGGAGDARQAEERRRVALVHDAAAGEAEVLGVLHHRQAVVLGVEQRAAHQLGVHHRLAVVGDRHRAGGGHLADLRQLLPLEPFRHRADRIDAGEAVTLRLAADVLRDRAVIVRTGTVFAMQQTAVKPPAAAAIVPGAHRLLVLLPRLAQVDVDVDEAGRDDEAGGVDDLGVLGHGETLLQPRHLAVLDQHVDEGVEVLARVDDAAAADQRDHAASPCAPEHRYKHRHAHGDAVGDLLEDHRALAVGDVAGDLDAAVHRPRMHHQRVVLGELQALAGEPEELEVLLAPTGTAAAPCARAGCAASSPRRRRRAPLRCE